MKSLEEEPMLRLGLAVMLITFGGSNFAQAKETKKGTLFFSTNEACLAPPNCQIPASNVFPNPNDYTTLATLTLPEGDYLVTAKLSAFANGGTSYVNFECAIEDPVNHSPKDMSSFDGTAEQTLFMQTPVSFSTGSGGMVRVGCRAYGFKYDGTLVDMHVWNVNITAIPVSAVSAQ
jgi:hypothetical protein